MLTIEVKGEDRRLITAIHRALLPESTNPPSSECSIKHVVEGDKLVIEIYCSRINLLRAVANSYLGAIASLLKSIEVIGYESAEASTRSTTSSDRV